MFSWVENCIAFKYTWKHLILWTTPLWSSRCDLLEGVLDRQFVFITKDRNPFKLVLIKQSLLQNPNQMKLKTAGHSTCCSIEVEPLHENLIVSPQALPRQYAHSHRVLLVQYLLLTSFCVSV
jgi:hypothetical protein